MSFTSSKRNKTTDGTIFVTSTVDVDGKSVDVIEILEGEDPAAAATAATAEPEAYADADISGSKRKRVGEEDEEEASDEASEEEEEDDLSSQPLPVLAAKVCAAYDTLCEDLGEMGEEEEDDIGGRAQNATSAYYIFTESLEKVLDALGKSYTSIEDEDKKQPPAEDEDENDDEENVQELRYIYEDDREEDFASGIRVLESYASTGKWSRTRDDIDFADGFVGTPKEELIIIVGSFHDAALALFKRAKQVRGE